VEKFQLVYGRPKNPMAVTWSPGRPLSHHRVDEGEDRPGRPKMAPVLIPADAPPDLAALAASFAGRARDLDPAIRRAVLDALGRQGGKGPDPS